VNGSVQAPETLYWWAAQLLVENGYLVMTFDPRAQGYSDLTAPGEKLGSN
jgi:alpha-beta hydrolase superfamily lysophospholipase